MPRFYTYGPFKSRRLGLSLGVNILPNEKICTCNCVYCEIGDTVKLVSPEYRFRAPPSPKFYNELKEILKYFPHLDSITFGYNGEPTLNENLLDFYNITKLAREEVKWADKPPIISIFTNSSTLHFRDVRTKIKSFDMIIAKLDCATDNDYYSTNRPHKNCVNPKIIIESLAQLKKVLVKSKLALQCLIYNSNRKDFISNNNEENINQLANAIRKIQPDLVQIYSIARIPSEPFVFAIDEERKKEIVTIIKKNINNDLIQIEYY